MKLPPVWGLMFRPQFWVYNVYTLQSMAQSVVSNFHGAIETSSQEF